MEAGLGSCFLNHGWCYGAKLGNSMQWPAHPIYRASCKMRNRNQSSQNKRYPTKKIYRPARANLPTNGGDDSQQEKFSNNSIGSLRYTTDSLDRIVKQEQIEQSSSDSIASMEEDADVLDALVEKGTEIVSEISITGLNNSDDSIGTTAEADQSNKKNSLTMLNNYPSVIADADDQLSTVRLDDLVGMIRNAQRNIHVINQARIRALEDLEVIVDEKDTLQDEINNLELKLVETDARLRVATQQKVHMEILEDQLQKLQNELSNRGSYDNNLLEEHSITSFSHVRGVDFLSEELDALKKENTSLKNDLNSLKEELTVIKGTEERVNNLEKERLILESSLTELQVKLSASEDEVAKLSSLRSECKSLDEKVEDLQKLLDKATKQADQAIFVLQENQELRKKVDKLEQSLEEATVYKLSSERLQHFNDLMQQKLNILEQCLQKSDEEIHGYVQLYQDSVKEFQDTLDNLKDESKKRTEDKAVKDMPREFWSQLLLVIDAWLLEKKILTDEARLLREMVWQRDAHICNTYISCKGKKEELIISSFLGLLSSPQRSELHVIHIAAEMAPVAKVGGLGDVVTGLGKALQKRGHLVEIILPKYDCMQYELIHDLRVLDVVVESFFDGQLFENKIWTGTVEGLPVYFIEPHHPGNFFWRGQFYGEQDDFKRFSFFSRAALELLLQSGKKPDIIHCHDWQTSFVAPLYWDLYAPKGLNSARICFTCHNFEYQGTAPAWDLGSCGLDVRHLNRPDRMQDNFSHDRVNPIKGAIVFSNIVTTVSPTYSQEVRTAEGGQGLHSTLNTYAKKFVGILNGIDTDTWNPASDTLLEVQYSAFDTDGKAQNKEALRRKFGLAFANGRQPLVFDDTTDQWVMHWCQILALPYPSLLVSFQKVGCITRLVPQKGVHLIRHAIYRTLELGGQFVLLGSSPVPQIQREFEDIANQFQNHEHARLFLKYDESLARLIYGASDMLIIPSIFEPCGLTQMIAMRYGTIPIARKTGGLNDSVFDVDDDTIPEEFRNGFTFVSADEPGFNGALERAFSHYMSNEVFWQQLVEKVMKIDFSWDSSAAVYEELYEKAVVRARASNRSLA